LADSAPEYFPAAQVLQDKWSVVFVPAGHPVHFFTPSFEIVPTGHS
jgi:hypothetical protein